MNENVFFGNGGITSTSANFYANISQELVQDYYEKLNSLRFYQVSVSSIGSSEKQLMTAGSVPSILDSIESILAEIASMNSLCAWLREAIKAKELLLLEVARVDIFKWMERNNIDIPKPPKEISKKNSITESDIINSWDAKKRNRYLTLEAFASTFGKCIHPNGSFSKARQELHKVSNCPIYTEGSGRDLILYYQEPIVNVSDVDTVFLNLQSKYRSFEKELNYMKAELKEAVNNANNDIEKEYQDNLSVFKKEYDEYTLKMKDLRSQHAIWLNSEKDRISKLGIIIPKELLETYNKVVSIS